MTIYRNNEKESFWKHLWRNSRLLLIFTFLFIPAFVGLGAILAQRWGVDYTLFIGFSFLVGIGSTIGDYFRWKRL